MRLLWGRRQPVGNAGQLRYRSLQRAERCSNPICLREIHIISNDFSGQKVTEALTPTDCPECHVPLVLFDRLGAAYYSCPECAGDFVPVDSCQSVLELAGDDTIWSNQEFAQAITGPSRLCPCCHIDLARLQISRANTETVEIYRCTVCRGLWVPAGRRALLRRVTLEITGCNYAVGPARAAASAEVSRYTYLRDADDTSAAFTPTRDERARLARLLGEVGPYRSSVVFAVTASIIAVAVGLLVLSDYMPCATYKGCLRSGALYGPAIASGEWWRIVTAPFLHGGPGHLFWNALALISLCVSVERYFGHRRTIFLLCVSALSGEAFSLGMHFDTYSIGISGAIMGLVGANFAFIGINRRVLPSGVSTSELYYCGQSTLMTLMGGLTTRGVDNAAHVGGLVAGAVLGAVLSKRLTSIH